MLLIARKRHKSTIKKDKYKKPKWLVRAENKIEKMTDEEFDEVFEETYAKLKKVD